VYGNMDYCDLINESLLVAYDKLEVFDENTSLRFS
jgi:hypothetical protein